MLMFGIYKIILPVVLYICKMLSLTWGEEHKLQVSGDSVQKSI